VSNLHTHLSQHLLLSEAFSFPLRSSDARRDVLIGGLWMFLPLIGWILNLGHRLEVVHRLYSGDTPYFRGYHPLPYIFRRGLVAASAIFCYLFPAILSFIIALLLWINGIPAALFVGMLGAVFFVLGVFTLPGCMTVYACEGNSAILAQPLKAFQRAWAQRAHYFYAWLIALFAIGLSFFGLLLLGVGFFFTSVWAWQVVGYAFTVSMYAPVPIRATNPA
jgi:hypothetical protein